MHRTVTKHIVRHMQKSVVQWSVISKFTCSNKDNISDIIDKREDKTGQSFTNGELQNAFILNHQTNVNMYISIAHTLEFYMTELLHNLNCVR